MLHRKEGVDSHACVPPPLMLHRKEGVDSHARVPPPLMLHRKEDVDSHACVSAPPCCIERRVWILMPVCMPPPLMLHRKDGMDSHAQGRIQDLWKGGGGAAAVPFEDPLWNFKRGGRRGRAPSLALLEDPLWNFKRGARPPAPPPPNPLVMHVCLHPTPPLRCIERRCAFSCLCIIPPPASKRIDLAT